MGHFMNCVFDASHAKPRFVPSAEGHPIHAKCGGVVNHDGGKVEFAGGVESGRDVFGKDCRLKTVRSRIGGINDLI